VVAVFMQKKKYIILIYFFKKKLSFNQRYWHDKIQTIFYVIRRAREMLQDWKSAKMQTVADKTRQ
jgi:hypothetical protein